MQEYIATGLGYALAFLSKEAVWYVIAGAAGWELIRWLLWRRPKSALSEQQILNRASLWLIAVIVASLIAISYRMYWMGMAGWHEGALWVVHILFILIGAVAIGFLMHNFAVNTATPRRD